MAENRDFSYIGYQEMIADMTMALENTRETMQRLDLPMQAERAREASARIKSHVFSVGIMGEFKRGKSTVINALLGEEIAPSDVVPASATLNRITYGLKPKATIVYKDGRREVVPVDQIAQYVTKITAESEATAELVEQAIVEYPCPFCQNNVEIYDTPGLNDDDRMDAISESVIPRLDAVVMVVAANAPFGKSEADFVREKLMTSDVTRLIVVVNQIDIIMGEKNRQKVLESIRAKIVREILDRAEKIHGKDSRVYRDAETKLADLKLYPISALQALTGRVENQPELVEQSGILALEDRLRRLLTQERGALEIGRAASLVTALIAEGENALNLRLSALEMDAEEFLKNQKEAEEKIRQLRRETKEEVKRIHVKGGEIKRQMEVTVADKYTDLNSRLDAWLDQYPITPKEVGNEKGQDRLREKISAGLKSEVSGALSDYMEQINVYLAEQIGDERLKIQEYMGDLSSQLTDIGASLRRNGNMETAYVLGVDALSNLVAATCTGLLSSGGFGLMGLGGLIEGYRMAGLKGAGTGLLAGAASSTVMAVGLITMMGAVPIIPFALITGAAGTMAGKLATSVIWKGTIEKEKVDKFRQELKKSARDLVDDFRRQKLLEKWAQEQVETQIRDLVGQVEQESETMIAGTEDTLQAIAADIVKAKENKEQKTEECRNLAAKLKEIGESLAPIMRKVNAALAETEA